MRTRQGRAHHGVGTYTRDGLARCAVVRFLSVCRRLPAGSTAELRIDDRLPRYLSEGATPQSALHIITRRSVVNLQRCSKGYSPKCLEGKFCELRVDGVLRSSHAEIARCYI